MQGLSTTPQPLEQLGPIAGSDCGTVWSEKGCSGVLGAKGEVRESAEPGLCAEQS